MNQILYTELNKKKTTDIKLIMKIFAIIIIIFGLFITSNASYTIYKNGKQNAKNNEVKPVITVENIDETNILISARTNKEISNIVYQWNDEEPITVKGNGTSSLESKVEIPSGTNMLKVTATDINGQTIDWQKEYILAPRPEIKLSVEGIRIKANITSEEGLSYVTFRWDENDEKNAQFDGETATEIRIDIPKGRHTLTITAVDINNNSETKTQEVNGVTKPVLEVTTDGENFIVKATDNEQLQKLEYTLNGETNSIDISGTEYEYSIPLVDGDNKLIITVYNSNGLSVEKKARCEK